MENRSDRIVVGVLHGRRDHRIDTLRRAVAVDVAGGDAQVTSDFRIVRSEDDSGVDFGNIHGEIGVAGAVPRVGEASDSVQVGERIAGGQRDFFCRRQIVDQDLTDRGIHVVIDDACCNHAVRDLGRRRIRMRIAQFHAERLGTFCDAVIGNTDGKAQFRGSRHSDFVVHNHFDAGDREDIDSLIDVWIVTFQLNKDRKGITVEKLGNRCSFPPGSNIGIQDQRAGIPVSVLRDRYSVIGWLSLTRHIDPAFAWIGFTTSNHSKLHVRDCGIVRNVEPKVGQPENIRFIPLMLQPHGSKRLRVAPCGIVDVRPVGVAEVILTGCPGKRGGRLLLHGIAGEDQCRTFQCDAWRGGDSLLQCVRNRLRVVVRTCGLAQHMAVTSTLADSPG